METSRNSVQWLCVVSPFLLNRLLLNRLNFQPKDFTSFIDYYGDSIESHQQKKDHQIPCNAIVNDKQIFKSKFN